MLPTWMRGALFATAVMNILAAFLFLPSAGPLREVAGMPPGGHPVYLATIAMFVLLFGFGYLWTAIAGRAERLFITLSAIGKLTFVTLLVGYWMAGALPVTVPLAAVGDLVFAILFLRWLLGPQPAATAA